MCKYGSKLMIICFLIFGGSGEPYVELMNEWFIFPEVLKCHEDLITLET